MRRSDFLEELKARIRGRGLTVVFPESDDERIVAAARVLQKERLANVTLIAAPGTPGGDDAGEFGILDPSRSPELDAYVTSYRAARPRTAEKVARRLVQKPLFFAGMMLKSGAAHAMVAGASVPSARVIEASLLTAGLAAGVATPSSCFLMLLDPRRNDASLPGVLLFADCALNVDPDAGQLADIAVSSAASWRAITGDEPRVAMLSFSTRGSATHERARRVRQAADIAARRMPDTAVDGELQFDAAISATVADAKLSRRGEVAGRANVLVFPGLEAGNIAYKITQYLAGAVAVGPLLQGFAAPVSDLSRGATVDDIVGSAVLALVLGDG